MGKFKCNNSECGFETDDEKLLGKYCPKCSPETVYYFHRHAIKYKDWGKDLNIYQKTRKAILEILESGEMRKSKMYHEFWLRGFITTSSALTKHLDKLCMEKKIIRIKFGITTMCGDDSTYTLTK